MITKYFQYEFAQNEFLAGTIIAIIAAIVGYFVVLRAQAFIAHAFAHIGFAGATGAAVIGIEGLLGTIIFTMAAALFVGLLDKRIQGRDIEIGMVLSFALGLGVLFLSLYTRFANQTISILFGSILSVKRGDVWIMLGCGIFALILLGLVFRPLLFASVDPELAETRGVPVQVLALLFLLILALTVAEAVQVVGILLLFALLVAPAATASRLFHRPLSVIILAVILSLAFTWGGLLLAFTTNWPVSFLIASLAALSYFIVTGLTMLRHRLPHKGLVSSKASIQA